jgi:hypothetical protein
VADTAVLPHFETFGHRWVESAEQALPGATLLGIDERSAAVWRDARWHAMGPGVVTLIKAGKSTRFEPGREITGLRAPARILSE